MNKEENIFVEIPVAWKDSENAIRFVDNRKVSKVGYLTFNNEAKVKLAEALKIPEIFEGQKVKFKFDVEKIEKYFADIKLNWDVLKQVMDLDKLNFEEITKYYNDENEYELTISKPQNEKQKNDNRLLFLKKVNGDNTDLVDAIMGILIGGVSSLILEKTNDNTNVFKLYPILYNDVKQIIKNKFFSDYSNMIKFCDFEFHGNNSNKPNNNKNYNIQKIYYGAPGTGKSHAITEQIKKSYPNTNEKDNPFVFKTTVYSDYSYYDFVGKIEPAIQGENVTYAFKPGIFTNALKMAINNSDKDIYLVVEEMTRGDIASIFGDIFQLLDRDNEGNSEYSINNLEISKEIYGNENVKISLPKNLHILGTLNTCDQNVNVMDTAFKRRFQFEYLTVDPIEVEGEFLNDFTFEYAGNQIWWRCFYMAINQFIVKEMGLNEDKQLGQFFIKGFIGENSTERNKELIKNKLLMYLWEDVHLARFTNEKTMFNSNLNSFSDVYRNFEQNREIFSKEFMDFYKTLIN